MDLCMVIVLSIIFRPDLDWRRGSDNSFVHFRLQWVAKSVVESVLKKLLIYWNNHWSVKINLDIMERLCLTSSLFWAHRLVSNNHDIIVLYSPQQICKSDMIVFLGWFSIEEDLSHYLVCSIVSWCYTHLRINVDLIISN